MTAGIHNFVCERGAEFKRKISWVDVEGEPIDMSSFWIDMQVRKTFGDDPELIALSEQSGVWNDTPGFYIVDSEVILYIDAATTRDFEPGVYVYDIVVGVDPDADNPALPPQERYVRLMQGQFTVNDWVTDPRPHDASYGC